MISHELKCIFIHIPGTGGSSIERFLVGRDWYDIDPDTKHISLKQAKLLYANYWDSYFKFTWVRHPLKRLMSLTRFPDAYFGMSYIPQENFDKNLAEVFLSRIAYANNIFIETKNPTSDDIINSYPKSIYHSYVSDELDFVGRLEYMQLDFRILLNLLGLRNHKSFINERLDLIHINTPVSSHRTLRDACPEAIDYVYKILEFDYINYQYQRFI